MSGRRPRPGARSLKALRLSRPGALVASLDLSTPSDPASRESTSREPAPSPEGVAPGPVDPSHEDRSRRELPFPSAGHSSRTPDPHVGEIPVQAPHVQAPHVQAPHVSAIPAIMERVAEVEASIPHGRRLPHYDEAMAALFGDACWTDHLRRSGSAGVAMRDGAILHDLVPRLWRPRPVLRGGRVVGFAHAAPDHPRPPDPAAVARLGPGPAARRPG